MPKIYAIKYANGKSWIGNSWTDCEERIRGKTGVKYKSFAKTEDAESWITGIKPKRKGLYIYVDGSFMPHSEYAGWSWVAVDNGKEIASDSGRTPGPAMSRNIDGEVYAAWKAMEFLAKKKRKGVICHDYEGIAYWAEGKWKTNSSVSQIYVNRIADVKMWATFEKVTGHSGNEWNDKADRLAKEAIGES